MSLPYPPFFPLHRPDRPSTDIHSERTRLDPGACGEALIEHFKLLVEMTLDGASHGALWPHAAAMAELFDTLAIEAEEDSEEDERL